MISGKKMGLVCWSLTSLCHSNGHIETMPAQEINPFNALTRIGKKNIPISRPKVIPAVSYTKLDQVGRPRPYMAPDIYQHSCQGSNLNSQNWSILWPWPAVMEGSRSKWSARCTSTLFPQLIGIIIREMEIIHKIEVFRDLDLQSWRGQGQNEVHVAHLHCSLSWLVSSLEESVQ